MRFFAPSGFATQQWTYDSLLRLTGIPTMGITYSCSPNAEDGKITSMTYTAAGYSVNYTYDALGRLGITALALAAATFSHAQGGPGGASQPTSDFAEEAILASAEKAFAKDPSTQVIRYFDPSCGGRTRPRSRGLTTYRQWREAVARSPSPKCPYAEVFGWGKVRLVRIFRDGQRVVKVINAPSEVESLLRQVVFATTSASGAARRRCQLFVRHGMPSVQWATEAYLALRRQFQDCELALFVRRDDCFGSELAFPVINLFAELHSCPPSDAVSGEYIACHGDVPGSPGCTIAFDEPQIGRQGLRNRGD